MREQPRHAVRAHDRQRRIELPLAQAPAPRRARRPSIMARKRASMRRRSAVAVRREEQLRERHCPPAARAGARRGTTRADARSPRAPRARAGCAAGRSGAACARSRDRARELGVQRRACRAPSLAAPHALAHRVGHGRDVRQPVGQRPEIEPGAADEDRQRAVGRVAASTGRGIAALAADRVVHRPVDMAEEPMRRLRLLVRRRPRGQDAQVAVDLHRIGVDRPRAERAAPARAPRPTCRWRSGLR